MPSLRILRYSKILKQRFFNSVLPKSKLKDDKESCLTKPVSWPSLPPSAPGLVLGLSTNWLMTNIRGWPLDPTLAVTLPRAPTRHSFLRRKSLLVTGSGLCCPPHFEATRTSRLRLSFHGNLWWSFIWHHLPCGDSYPHSIFLCFLVNMTWPSLVVRHSFRVHLEHSFGFYNSLSSESLSSQFPPFASFVFSADSNDRSLGKPQHWENIDLKPFEHVHCPRLR